MRASLRAVALASVVAQHAVGGFTSTSSRVPGRRAAAAHERLGADGRSVWGGGVVGGVGGGVGRPLGPSGAANAGRLALYAQPQKGSTLQGDQLDGPRPAEFKPEDAIDATDTWVGSRDAHV